MISKFKQKITLTTVFAILITILVGCSSLTNANSMNDNVKNSDTSAPSQSILPAQQKENKDVEKVSDTLDTDTIKEEASPENLTIEEKVEFYLEKLKDKSYTGTYGEGYTWYTAAEELGMLGKPAIPGLIEKLGTEDDYERALTLYALLLASQHENVKSFTNGEHIDVNLDFDVNNHPEMVNKAMAWWDKYKNNF